MTTFAREELSPSLWEEALPLLAAHWKEIARYADITLDPDIEAYARCQEFGAIRVYTARDPRGKLVGYALFFVRSAMHYRSSVQAVQDVFYVQPGARQGLLGARFIRYCDQELGRDGVQVVYQHVKQARNFGPLLERQGYEIADVIWAKRLDVASCNKPEEA